MKNILIIFIVITSLLISGCVGREDGGNIKVSEDKGTSEASDSLKIDSEFAQTPDLVIKPDDVPELIFFEYRIFAIPESDPFYVGSRPETYCTDALPAETRKVGEYSGWIWNISQRSTLQSMGITLYEYDSGEGFDVFMNALKDRFEGGEDSSVEGWEYGTSNIGEDCFYFCEPTSTSVSHTSLIFYTSDNEFVTIDTIGKEDKSIDEAIRIAEIVENRLDKSN